MLNPRCKSLLFSVEPWYVEAEYEIGVAGSDEENDEYYERLFHAYRSKRYPMRPLVQSYLDKQVAAAIDGVFAKPAGTSGAASTKAASVQKTQKKSPKKAAPAKNPPKAKKAPKKAAKTAKAAPKKASKAKAKSAQRRVKAVKPRKTSKNSPVKPARKASRRKGGRR